MNHEPGPADPQPGSDLHTSDGSSPTGSVVPLPLPLPPLRPVDARVLRRPRFTSWQLGCLVVSALVGGLFAGLAMFLGLGAAVTDELRCATQPSDCGAGLPTEAPLALLLVIVGYGLAMMVPKRRPWSWLFYVGCLTALGGPLICLVRLWT